MLKPEVSIPVGLATGVMVFAVYQNALPTVADVRVAKEQDPDIDSARKMAAWTSAGLVAAVSLLAKDPTVFIIGGVIVVGMDLAYRHADAVNPVLKKVARAVGSTESVTTAAADGGYGEG